VFKHRLLISVAVVVASYIPAASALAIGGTNHNETLLLDTQDRQGDDFSPDRWKETPCSSIAY
jgi:hypothetical protein